MVLGVSGHGVLQHGRPLARAVSHSAPTACAYCTRPVAFPASFSFNSHTAAAWPTPSTARQALAAGGLAGPQAPAPTPFYARDIRAFASAQELRPSRGSNRDDSSSRRSRGDNDRIGGSNSRGGGGSFQRSGAGSSRSPATDGPSRQRHESEDGYRQPREQQYRDRPRREPEDGYRPPREQQPRDRPRREPDDGYRPPREQQQRERQQWQQRSEDREQGPGYRGSRYEGAGGGRDAGPGGGRFAAGPRGPPRRDRDDAPSRDSSYHSSKGSSGRAAPAAPADARRPSAAAPPAAAAAASAAAAATVAAAATASGSSASVPLPAAALPAPALAVDPSSQLVAIPEGVYPTFVPRNPGIQDGEWGEADERMVRVALRDAAAVAAAGAGAGAGSTDAATPPPPGRSSSPGSPSPSRRPARAAPGAPEVLLGRDAEELGALAQRYGQPAFRGRQLQQGVLQGAKSVEDITTIPKEWRQQLLADGVRTGRSLLHHSVGDADGTQKYLLQLHDGRIVETVGIPADKRLTVCVSSQVGCPMRCTFCATGKGGFARNLGAHEIVDQVLTVQERFGKRVSNVVFMGMGEPLLNLPNVERAYHVLNRDLGIGGGSITISTVGVPNAIAKLAAAGLKATLAVSLHAPSQALRETIVPSAKAYPLEALMDDCVSYYRRTGRRVTFEYTLLSGVNDDIKHAKELVELLRNHDLLSHVNVIPWNPVDDSPGFTRPSRNRVFAFVRAVEAAGLTVTVRETRGLEAAAACGQLRNQFQKQPLPEFAQPL